MDPKSQKQKDHYSSKEQGLPKIGFKPEFNKMNINAGKYEDDLESLDEGLGRDLDVSIISEKDIPDAIDKIKSDSNITSFSLNIGWFESDELVTELFKAFKSQNFILHFKIRVSPKKFKNEMIIEFSNCLAILTSILDLEIDFSNCKKLQDSGVNSLARAIQNQKNLITLKLILHNTDIAISGLINLGVTLRLLKKIELLAIGFGHCKVNDQGVCAFASFLKEKTLLTSLYLSFGYNELLTSKSTNELVESLSGLINLRNLTLEFAVSQQEIMFSLGNCLKRFSALCSLTFLFSYSQLNDEGTCYLMKCIEDLPLINSMDLNLCATMVTDKGLKAIAECTNKLLSLKTFKLLICYTKISDESVRLFQTIEYKAMRVLRLNFTNTNATTECLLDTQTKLLEKGLENLEFTIK